VNAVKREPELQSFGQTTKFMSARRRMSRTWFVSQTRPMPMACCTSVTPLNKILKDIITPPSKCWRKVRYTSVGIVMVTIELKVIQGMKQRIAPSLTPWIPP